MKASSHHAANRASLEAHLAQAERHVTLGAEHLARQADLVAYLDRHGFDTTMARVLLDTFRELQASHTANRDRIRAELAQRAGSRRRPTAKGVLSLGSGS